MGLSPGSERPIDMALLVLGSPRHWRGLGKLCRRRSKMWGYLGVGQKWEPCLPGSKSNIIWDHVHPVHHWDNLVIGPFIWPG